ncbi:hypothetical protein Btru_054342 [Bulinus truncatus]|nr:hypothetical protein Btru_054342 [Bulinus truncatus]
MGAVESQSCSEENWRDAQHIRPIQAWCLQEDKDRPSPCFPSFLVIDDSDSNVSLGDDEHAVDDDVDDDVVDDEEIEVDVNTSKINLHSFY